MTIQVMSVHVCVEDLSRVNSRATCRDGELARALLGETALAIVAVVTAPAVTTFPFHVSIAQ